MTPQRPCPTCGCRLYKEFGPCAGEDAPTEAKGLPEVYATLRGIPEAMESAVFVDPRMQYWADQVRKAVNLASPTAPDSEGG